MEPTTTWSGAGGDYSTTGVANIVDPSGNKLVDPGGNFIVDSGVTFVLKPATIWTTDNSV